MRQAGNPNHPKKGSTIKVEPIKRLEDIDAIKALLTNHPRNYALFIIGINTNLRASDLLQIKVYHVRGLKAGDHFEIRERKTKKLRLVTLNRPCVEAIRRLLITRSFNDNEYLFRSQRQTVLTVSSVNRLLKTWCEAIGLKGNYGSHTLRKTWGYHQRVTFKTDLPLLVECFNHNTQRQTLNYLCIQPEEIKNTFNNEL